MSAENPQRKSVKKNASLRGKKPVSILHKPVTVDVKALIKALTKGVSNLATAQWDKLGGDFVEATLSLGLKTQPEELAFLLVYRSLSRAYIDLVAESINQLPAEVSVDAKEFSGLVRTAESELAKREFVLDKKFFKAPARFALLRESEQLLNVWLRSQGILPNAVASIVSRLPAYFVYAVHYELGRNRKAYDPLLQVVDTYVSSSVERELAWEAYGTLLNRHTEEAVFDEPFSLRQIYVPLVAAYHDDGRGAGVGEIVLGEDVTHDSKGRKVIDLKDELSGWLKRIDKSDAIRVLSGGPGSGKSSFAKIFAADLAAEGRRVLLVPLHLIDPERDLAEQVGSFSRQDGLLGFDPIDPNAPERSLLIIFDGLDELASQGKVGYNSAREFVGGVQRLVALRNLQRLSLQVIISGRELVVQENERLFQKPGQILDILPYFIPEDERKQFLDRSGLLERDLRNDWWKKYGALTDLGYESLPSELSVRDLEEITAQPLLNYLVALSLTRGKLDFGGDINLNEVYADLVEAVHERGYEKGRMHAALQHMSLKDFGRVLEEIGVAAWHGDGRSTTVGEIRDHCKDSGVGSLLDAFREGAEKGVTRLLAAFFFRRHGQRTTGDQTFVFTHKSFGEYLTARRVVLGMRKLSRDLLARDRDADEGRDEREVLEQWARTCGPSSITPYLVRFLRREISLQPRTVVEEWQAVFTRLFNLMLRVGMPMERLRLSSFREALRQNRNAEEALLVVLNACARSTGNIIQVMQSSEATFGTWIRRVQEQRTGEDCCVCFDCLSYLDLANACFHVQDFAHSNFKRSSLKRIRAALAQWSTANLEKVDMEGAWLVRANFGSATLVEANFKGANLESATLYAADATGARFDNANLQMSVLRGGKFTQASMTKASMRDADLRGAKLLQADLHGANLELSNLTGAYLDKANLTEANLTGANLTGANLTGANLTGANLTGADLTGADLTGVNLSRANLDGVRGIPN